MTDLNRLSGMSAHETIEAYADRTWRNDSKLRYEFSDSYDSYLAYLKAESAGQVRILGRKK